MTLLLGIDLGTSYFKVGLFDERGALKGLGRVAVSPESPAPGRVELPVDAFWLRLRQGVEGALAQAGVGAEAVAGVSYSSQANTFVLLDGSDSELSPLILWTDRRAHPLDPVIEAFGRSEEHSRITGMTRIVPERAPVKCRWIAENDPHIWSRVRKVMTISDYLTQRLTGFASGDSSTAALTGLLSLETGGWWGEALDLFGLSMDQLSHPLPPGSACGTTASRSASLLGIPAGVPFAVGALDHHAAALGAGLELVADACLSTGTVLAALALAERVAPAEGIIHGPHVDGKRFYRLAFDPNGAGELEEYSARIGPGASIEELLIRTERVHADPRGNHDEHGTAVLSILRRIAAAHRDLLGRVGGGSSIRRVAATGGGARSDFWLGLTAEAIGVPVLAVASPERACLGAAMFASVAAGIHPDIAAAARGMIREPRVFSPGGGPQW